MKPKILIADDSLTIRSILEKALTDWGFEVTVCSDGAEALGRLLEPEGPRVAVLDWEMPELSGIEVCRQISACGKLVYTILLTSKSEKEDLITGIDSGAYNFLTKPVPLPVLKKFIEVGIRLVSAEDDLKRNERRIRYKCYQAIALLADARDNETGLHLQRINHYATLLAKSANAKQQFVNKLAIFSQLHDIGKVGISDSILFAPRKLSDQEFTIVKEHSALGDKILRPVPTMEMAADIARYHHEKWDGTGYPDKISGENIPLSARIVGLVDVFDALRSDRPYKSGWSFEKTMQHIADQKGKHFDPVLVDNFMKLEKKLKIISDRYLALPG